MPVPAVPGDKWERERRQNRRDVLLYARVAFFIVGSMPWWLPLMRAYLPLGPVGIVLDGLYMMVCHRLPDRTLQLAGVAMPLCSRCAGIFTGLAMGALLVWPRLDIKRARWLLLGAGLLMLADVVTQELLWRPPWHTTRLITGIALGWIASAALMSAIIRSPRAA
jgi:uncharacterized membrane protein